MPHDGSLISLADYERAAEALLEQLDALPRIVDAVGDRIDVLVDGGIRRGTDVLKALALGARAVLVGRPVLWGLAVERRRGRRGACSRSCSRSSTTALALAGAPRAAELDRESSAQPRRWVARARDERPRHRHHRLCRLAPGPRLQRGSHAVRGFAAHPSRVELDVPVVTGDAVSGSRARPRRSRASTSPTS